MWYIGVVLGLGLCLAAAVASKRVLNAVVLALGPVVLLDFVGNIIYENAFYKSLADSTVLVIVVIHFSFFVPFAVGYISNVTNERGRVFARIEGFVPNKKRTIAYVLVTSTVALALVISISSRSGSPLFTRELYENTRNGYGPLFFGAQLLCLVNISLCTYFMGGVARLVFTLINLGIVSSLGAKGPVVLSLLLMILPYAARPVKGYKQLLGIVVVGLVVTLCAGYAFYYFTPWARDDLAVGLASYVDGTRNLGTLIETWHGFKLGKLAFEDNMYTILPRFLFPSKPIAWGTNSISDEMFRLTAIDKGAPSFTRFGRLWADFGYASLLVSAVIGYINGKLAGLTENSISRRPTLLATTIFLLAINQAYLNPGIIVLIIAVVNCGILACVSYVIGERRPGNFHRAKAGQRTSAGAA